jgi:hypothetical protein
MQTLAAPRPVGLLDKAVNIRFEAPEHCSEQLSLQPSWECSTDGPTLCACPTLTADVVTDRRCART